LSTARIGGIEKRRATDPAQLGRPRIVIVAGGKKRKEGEADVENRCTTRSFCNAGPKSVQSSRLVKIPPSKKKKNRGEPVLARTGDRPSGRVLPQKDFSCKNRILRPADTKKKESGLAGLEEKKKRDAK